MYQNCRNKIGMNGVAIWEENQKCFVTFSRPLHNLEFREFTSLSGRGRQRNVPKTQNARAGRAERLFLFIKRIVLWLSRSHRRRPYIRSLLPADDEPLYKLRRDAG